MTTTRVMLALALVLAGCGGAAPTDATHVPIASQSRAGHGPPAVDFTLSASSLTLAVGQVATVAATYTDKKGNVIPASNQPITFWGVTPQEGDAFVLILPALNGVSAQITGRAAGATTLYASDGLGRYVYVPVTVTP